PDVEAATADQILPMIKSDLGIGFVPMDFLEKENRENLVILNMTPDIPTRNICLLKRCDISLSLAASELERQIKDKKKEK
ncbi:MAG: LysR family transcriptional regulator, partial [Lachnospiraceae bacterium]|nr:LysR family transcriptional regulator [Lachnospiraceae bacterium]